CIHRETFNLAEKPIRKPETVYGITSLTAWQANPADALAANRGHWGIENREHYSRDRTFDEDRSQVRTGASPQFLATGRTRPGVPVPAPGLRPGAHRPLKRSDLGRRLRERKDFADHPVPARGRVYIWLARV
ncbi:MAG TPA: hypothetical protein VLW50_07780, partial [Streptosporangiaceae bacterium]|nr:hypothetical protein [Streptosporangiaceae bacterium]